MKKMLWLLLLFMSIVAIAGCASEDWNRSGSETPSGYHGGHHH